MFLQDKNRALDDLRVEVLVLFLDDTFRTSNRFLNIVLIVGHDGFVDVKSEVKFYE